MTIDPAVMRAGRIRTLETGGRTVPFLRAPSLHLRLCNACLSIVPRGVKRQRRRVSVQAAELVCPACLSK